jgi:hypothetical protein
MRELSATSTRTAFAACAGLVGTLITACLPKQEKSKFQPRPAPHSAFRAQLSTPGVPTIERFTVTLPGLQLGDRPGGGNSGPFSDMKPESELF